MAALERVLTELEAERSRAEDELRRLDEAIEAIRNVGGTRRMGNGRRGRRANIRRSGRKLSTAGRARIAAAPRARWERRRRARVGKPTRTLSQAARNRIAAAQRARWAKLKQQKQVQATRGRKKVA